MEWENLTSEEQVRIYWDYQANILDPDEDGISFSDFDEMMQGYIF